MAGESYVEREENLEDLNGSPMGQANPAKRMLEISDTNRIVISDRQAQLLNVLNFKMALKRARCSKPENFKPWEPIGVFYQDIQKLQLTRDSMSREDYKQVAISREQKKRGLFSAFSHKQSSTPEVESDGEAD